MRVRPALLGAALLGAPFTVSSQPVDGLYIGGGVGGNIMSDETLKSVTVPGALAPAVGGVIPLSGTRLNGHIRMDGGFAGEGSVGYGFGTVTSLGGPRVELEGNYSSNSFGGIGLGNGTSNSGLFGIKGQEQKYGAFANALWDFDLGTKWIYPYLGLGVGGQWSQWNARINNRLGFAAGFPQVTGFSSTIRRAASPIRRSSGRRSR